MEGDLERVAIFMAWPYANGPLHLGHVAGNCLPADIQYKYERARGRSVLMCSGSDEHGTPITLTAEQNGISPQDVVDKYHEIHSKSLEDLGCSWVDNVDPRGIDYGGTLYNRTSDPMHKDMVRTVFEELLEAGFLERTTMQQYCSISNGEVRFLPDRYVEGTCPVCSADGARGDQCDDCGSTYEANQLLNPVSKLDPGATVEIRDTDHMFFRLDLFQKELVQRSKTRTKVWKPNVRAMTKNWLDMGLRPRAVTRDIDWGITLPLEGEDWDSKRVYVWFEAVQGYYTCARIWAERFAVNAGHVRGVDAWENWWKVDSNGVSPKHIYFMGKDNIPFHTIIWPSIIMGMNAAASGNSPSCEPLPGELALESNVPANEYLMLQGGQFSKSRRHGVWLPSFLERYDPDTLRYYLTINMPEGHDSDFRWDEYVNRVNNELIGTYANFVHRVLTLAHRLPNQNRNPLEEYFDPSLHSKQEAIVNECLQSATESLERHRFKESLRSIMSIAQLGNSILQESAPWNHIKNTNSTDATNSLSSLAYCWLLCKGLAVTLRPFIPFQSDRLWEMLGCTEDIDSVSWLESFSDNSFTWNPSNPNPLFQRLDLESILSYEKSLADEVDSKDNESTPTQGGLGDDLIDYEDFAKVEMRTGKILSVEDHPNADKLFVVVIEDGPDSTRTVCAGLKGHYTPSQLEGLDIVFVANLRPRKLRGILSEGMLLAADDEDGNVRVLTPEDGMPSGSLIR
tara:strand:+ start:2040 stop:4253 length:2214 start_codon:yes stop_codon:yes gene_type:complete